MQTLNHDPNLYNILYDQLALRKHCSNNNYTGSSMYPMHWFNAITCRFNIVREGLSNDSITARMCMLL